MEINGIKTPLTFIQTLECEDKFDSAHHLECHNGKCKNLHGHTWEVHFKITLERKIELDKTGLGMIIDFSDLKNLVKELDHKNLNEYLGVENPTAEYLSAYFAEKVIGIFMEQNKLEKIIEISVKVSEGGSSTIETSIDYSSLEYLYSKETDPGVVNGC